MPKRWSTRDVERVLLAHGFRFVSQRGSHRKYVAGPHVVILPAGRKEIREGTFASILRQSGLTRVDFE